MMNDEQLIELVQQKLPEDLSLDEVRNLRDRLTESEQLREALLERLKLEHYLAAALGRVDVSVDAILKRAQEQRDARSSLFLTLFGGAVVLALFTILAALVIFQSQRFPGGRGDGADVAEVPDSEREPPQIAVSNDGQNGDQDTEPAAREPSVPDDGSVKPVTPTDGAGRSGDRRSANGDEGAMEEGADLGKPFVITVQAERFARGNAHVDDLRYGTAQTKIIRSESLPTFAEYEITVPREGKYQIRAHYAAQEPRPVRFSINGKAVADAFAGDATGGWAPQHQRWLPEGEFSLVAGKNVLRLASGAHFPHIDQLIVADPEVDDLPALAAVDVGEEEKLPWQRSLERAPQPFDDVWLAGFATDEGPLTRDGLLKWFASVAGQPNRLHESSRNNIKFGVLDGVYRLRPALPADAVWKMAVHHSERFLFHIYHGDQGVTIRRYEHANGGWAAYQTQREPDKPLPKSAFLTATDDSRASRSEAYYGRTYLIWYADGEIVVTVGDVEILRAPLPGPPTDVYVQGKAMFDGMALVPTEDLPQKPAEFPVVATVDRPADLEWSGELPEGAELKRLPDGAVELAFEKPADCGWIAARLPSKKLCVVDVLVEEASLGTSVFLGGGARLGDENKPVAEGKPESVVSVMINQHSKRINLQQRFVHDWGIGQESRQIEQHVEPCALLPFHVRFLASPGQVRYWISPDGIHWTGAFPLHAKDVRNVQYVGIGFGNGMEKPGSIRLKRIMQRELAALSALAPAAVRQRAVAKTAADDISAWIVATVAEKPADVSLDVWRRACAIQALAAGCNGRLGQPLLECLLADAMQFGTLEARLVVLEEAALLTSTWKSDDEHRERLNFFLGQYRQLARDAAQAGQTRPFSLVRLAAMSAPLSTDTREKLFDKELIRDETIRLAYGQQWLELDRFLRELQFFSGSSEYLQQVAPLEPWARAMIARHLPKRGGSDVVVIKPTWRHPLVEEWSKETFNVCAELYTALSSEAWADACRIITSVDPRNVVGLAPSSGDERLLVSLPAVVDIVMREYPSLRANMADQLASIGQVRLNRACAEGDAGAVKAVALQFHGTPAAAQAHRWLGDRALSSGRFSVAMSHYEQAGAVTPETTDTDLGARSRLAAALMGEEYGQPVTTPVRVGDTVIAPAEFEQMVADLRTSRGRTSLQPLPMGESETAWDEPPDAAEFQFRETARFDAYLGAEPHHHPRGIREREIHPIDRQLSWVVANRTLYANNRFQVAAFDLNSGQRKWISQVVPGPQANALEWPLIPMRPFVTAARIYARQLAAKSPAIVCLDRSNGKNVWMYHDPQSVVVASDPIVVRGRLMVFVVKKGEAETVSLQLAVLDPADGQVIETRSVVNLRDSWQTTSVCQVQPLKDQIVAVLGGTVISLDSTGNVRWVRRQLQMPPDEDHLWIRQDHQLPLIHDSKLYVTCPGVRTIDCIDPPTGSLQFSRVMPYIERCLGIAEGKLIVQNREAIEAVDPATGETVWRHKTTDPLAAYLCGSSVIYSRRFASEPARNLRAPELVWLDPETGREVAVVPVPQMSDDWPRLAALIPYEKRLWALFGRGEQRYRALGELTPAGKADPQPTPEELSDPWLAHVPAELHEGAARVLPGWTVLSGQDGERTGYLADINGEKGVFGAISRAERPVVLVREIEIPSLGRPRLKGRLWVKHGQVLEMDVYFGGQSVFSMERPDSQSSQWMDLDVDLAPQKSRHGVLSVHVRFLRSGEETNIFWKFLELMY